MLRQERCEVEVALRGERFFRLREASERGCKPPQMEKANKTSRGASRKEGFLVLVAVKERRSRLRVEEEKERAAKSGVLV